MLKYNPTPSEKEVIMMSVNDGFKLSTAATEIALNNRRLEENPENFGGQNWLLRLAARHGSLGFARAE